MSVLEQIYEKAKKNPQRIAFPEALNEKMLQAAYETGKEGYIIPVLVGHADESRAALSEKGYEESIFVIVDIREETCKKDLIDRYVALPQALLKEKALNRRMQNPLYYAMVMQAVGEADVTFAGIDNTTGDVLLGGGMVHNEDLVKQITDACSFIAPVSAYPGEFEMEAMAAGAIRVLEGEEALKTYTGKLVWDEFDWE